jgi:hypothetical protein
MYSDTKAVGAARVMFVALFGARAREVSSVGTFIRARELASCREYGLQTRSPAGLDYFVIIASSTSLP